jgi:hypothetical protein
VAIEIVFGIYHKIMNCQTLKIKVVPRGKSGIIRTWCVRAEVTKNAMFCHTKIRNMLAVKKKKTILVMKNCQFFFIHKNLLQGNMYMTTCEAALKSLFLIINNLNSAKEILKKS